MPQPVSTAAHGNAPLSAAGNPDAAARVAMVNHAAVNDEPRDVRAGKALLGGTVTIDRPRELLYSFWRDFNNLPRFMHNIEHVSSDGSVRSHWVVAAPAGQTLEWDAAMVEDRPGRLISWKSLDGASVRHSGRVEFRDSPDARGTVVTLTITYEPPGGSVA